MRAQNKVLCPGGGRPLRGAYGRGVDVEWVGHPYLEEWKSTPKSELKTELGLDPKNSVVELPIGETRTLSVFFGEKELKMLLIKLTGFQDGDKKVSITG